MPTDLKTSIQSALQAFAPLSSIEGPSADFSAGHLALLKTLGYSSDKTFPIAGAKPTAFLEMLEATPDGDKFDQEKALFNDWKKADLLFQLTNEELSGERSLFEETEIKPGLLQSYLFFAIELNGKSTVNGAYARGKLTAIARQINRVFPMPVMVLIKHPHEKKDVLSIAVINRRVNKREQHKDVLGKVTIIRDISIENPHPGHIDILDSFAVTNLKHPEKLPINSFESLHTAWEEIFNVELLNKRFYKELANWYFWALPQVEFPEDLEPDDEKRRATGLIRLLTRLIFCWFIKEKGLIPEKLFHRTDLDDILKDFDPDSRDDSQYYHAILQNLFFATLNQRMGKNNKGESHRKFALDEGFAKNRSTHDLNNYYRYESLFAESPEAALSHFADVPFLNGGLFECLDRRIEEAKKTYYLDGFSRNAKKRPQVPNYLFFSDEIKDVDLSEVYHDKKRKKESVSGLIRILNRYKFTIVENTPIDQEIALDPELLGKVFENLLASYNEETKTTARKQTGSFYTPRPIVDYMVDESIKAHLAQALSDKAGMRREDAEAGLDILFAYTEREHAFTDPEKRVLIQAIDDCKILDPACGSGAFPMGVLHKLVFILGKLDSGNKLWRQRQMDAANAIPDSTIRDAAVAAIEDAFDKNEDDYGRKLYLIENCLYGVDIQPIAIQISKLRFFISLICDQKTNRDKAKNHGIRPLPNLETKFVAADTLIGMPEMEQSLLVDPRVGEIEQEIESLYHRHFGIQRRDQKIALQRRIKELRKNLGGILSESLMAPTKAQHVADWDPFDPQASADFFDPHWMFGKQLSDGFDVVIGNPPYVQIQKFPKKQKETWVAQGFETYAATADIYCLFYERGAQLLKDYGILSFIVSNTWLPSITFNKTRSFIANKLSWSSLVSIQTPIFTAVVDTVVTVMHKRKPEDTDKLEVYVIKQRDVEFYQRLNRKDYPINGDPINVLTSLEDLEILRRVFHSSVPIREISTVYNGVKPFEKGKGKPRQTAEIVKEKPYVLEKTTRPEGAHWKPLLRGSLINRYVNLWNNDSWINYGPWLAAPRKIEIFDTTNKILVRQTGDRIIATVCREPMIARNNLHVIVPDPGIDSKYLLGVLNSKMTALAYEHINPEKGEALAEVKKQHVETLPIPKASKPQQAEVSNIVTEILSKKLADSKSDTTELERRIDEIVFSIFES